MAVPGEVGAEIGWKRAIVDRDVPSALIARARRNGGIMRVRVPLPGRFWLITDPDLIDRVLRTGAGEFDKGGPIYRIIRNATGDEGLFAVNDPQTWRILREHTNPAFAAGNLTALAHESVRRLIDRIDSWSPDRGVDVFTEFKLLNVELLAQHLFGQAVDCATLVRLAQPIFDSQRKQWFRIGGGRYQRAIAAMDTEVHAIIDRRRSLDDCHGDLLGHLLQARPDIPVQRIRDQVVSHLMAGFDSTACAQAWACVRLADHPAELAELRTEVEALGGCAPTAADLTRMPLLTTFFGDVVAQRPSFPLIFRNVAADTELAGRALRPGDQLFIAPGPAGLPFGIGRRKCIGEPLALLTGALSIAVLLQRFGRWQRIRPGDQQVRYATTAPPRHSEIRFTPRAQTP
ncbi:cytochrome P450 [Nocardia sp. NBC_00565]|uniref:cytochrome P450 n=1 Tax=Nocardia sp. NBC_00565 TaxID=2975993 RepID=UPI002E8108A5|nr:cytochrome P450 [Nocardia sp. NBC_00565]WUC00273.1 cytochrome P450 [Nocardia sp. NBC_00565]